MKNAPQTSAEKIVAKTKESQKRSIWQKLKSTKLKYAAALMLLVSSCNNTDDPIDDRDYEKPKVALSKVTLVDNDGDGMVNDITGMMIATDNEKVVGKTISAGGVSGSVNGNDFIVTDVPTGTQVVLGKAEDPSGNEGKATETVTVEAADVDSTVSNPNPTINENSTTDISLGIEDENEIDTVVFKDAATNQLFDYFDLEDNNKLVLKKEANGDIIKMLNHEQKPEITGVIVIRDKLGNKVEKNITVKLNDLQEEQTIDVFADGGLLPNGEKYAIKTDEEESGQTLPIMYYNHDNNRRIQTDVENEIINSSTGYSDAQTDIYNLNGTGIAPTFSNGQAMVSFDDTTNEMIIHVEDGSESVRIGRSRYGQMMAKIMERTGINNSVNFVQDGTVLNTVWEDMIVLQANNPTKLYVSVDKAIQNHLSQ